MKTIFYMYELEIVTIIATSIGLAILLLYIRIKTGQIQKEDENYQQNPEYIKTIKMKKTAYILFLPCIAGALFSMAYFTFYKPPIESQTDTYKTWALRLYKTLDKFQKLENNMKQTFADAPKGITYCKNAENILNSYPQELALIKKELEFPPTGIEFEKRKNLTEAFMTFNTIIDGSSMISGNLKEITKDIELVLVGNTGVNKSEVDRMTGNIKKMGELFDASNMLYKAGLLKVIGVGFDFGIMYKDGNFIKVDKSQVKPEIDNHNKETIENSFNTPTSQNSNNDLSVSKVSNNDPLSLGGVSLNNTESEIKSILGAPNSTETKNSGTKVLKYNDVEVYTTNGKIEMLVSNSPNAKTSKGIHEQSYIADFTREYGNDYKKSEYNNLDLIEYDIKDKNGNPCILRFAVVKGDNKVNYISIRQAD